MVSQDFGSRLVEWLGMVHVRVWFGSRIKGIALESDSLLNDLQSSLQKQEAKLTAYARQQEEVCDFWFVR